MPEFWNIAKRLLLGLVLMAAAASVLLLSDLRSRKTDKPAGAPGAAVPAKTNFRIALVQHASQLALDDGVKGIVQGLAEKGLIEGKNLTIKRFNPEGDLPTANAIAKDISSSDYDLVLTASTISMQTVANANKAGKVRHVFGLVSDPYGAGIGINRSNHLDHPKHLTGYATLQPVTTCFELLRQFNPGVKKVGVAWNPSEANSEVQLKLARAVCSRLEIELIEANADNSAAVGEAVNSVVARGAEALWIPGDVTILVAVEAVLQTAKKSRIPVFTVIPPNTRRGALFDLGADYVEVGHLTGLLGGEVLLGKDPATVPVENLVPEALYINKLALKGLKPEWQIPQALLDKATVIIDETGEHKKEAAVKATAAASVPPIAKQWHLHLINYNDSAPAEQVIHGFKDGLKAQGLQDGNDFTIKYRNAQGDIATLNTIFDAAQAEKPDLYIILSTPTLQVAVKKVKSTPLVFAFVSNPMLAGAATDYTNHLPNMTGISSVGPYAQMCDLLVKHFPKIKRVGTLFCPAEVNAVYNKELFTEVAAKHGITVVSLPANTASDLPDAAAALCAQQIDAVVQIVDNLMAAGFSPVVRAANRSKMPVFSFNSLTVKEGAPIVVSRDYYHGGFEAAELAARVMRGESPAKIPISFIKKTSVIVHLPNAEALGMNVPESLIKVADEVITK